MRFFQTLATKFLCEKESKENTSRQERSVNETGKKIPLKPGSPSYLNVKCLQLFFIKHRFVILNLKIKLAQRKYILKEMSFFFFFPFLFCFSSFWRQGFSMQPWLSWNSLCRPGWPRTQKSVCLCLPSAGIKGVHHHCPAKFKNK